MANISRVFSVLSGRRKREMTQAAAATEGAGSTVQGLLADLEARRKKRMAGAGGRISGMLGSLMQRK